MIIFCGRIPSHRRDHAAMPVGRSNVLFGASRSTKFTPRGTRMMKTLQTPVFAAAALLAVIVTPAPSMAQDVAPAKARNVVLVHGAYADGSSWSEVIPLLQKAGLRVTSVQNPLTSFKDDVDATKRVLALQDGPTVLVGHSYAGMVISETGVDPKVSALV